MPYRFLDFELDPVRYQLRRADAELPIPRQTFELILLLIRHRDRPVTKDEILQAVWQGRTVTDASLTHAIARARKALGDTPDTQAVIKTLHGRGYWWVAETEEVPDGSVQPSLLEMSPFVGRATELTTLSKALAEAAAGKGSLVLLLGEAGIGKTRLAEEFAARVARDQFEVIFTTCLEGEGAPPGWPWIQLLRTMLDTKRGSHSPPGLSDSIAYLQTVFPELAPPETPSSSRPTLGQPTERFRVFDSIWKILGALAHQRPLLLVIDDLHRADSLSLSILKLLVRQLGSQRMLVLATARDIAPQSSSSISGVGDVARQSRASTLPLAGLSRGEISHLLTRLQCEPAGNLIDALYERSAGNPFFLIQLVHTFRGTGITSWSDVLQGVGSLPNTLRESILLQMEDLESAPSEMLGIASVAGRTFFPTQLADASGVPLQDVLEALEAPKSRGLIEPDPRTQGALRFRHVLVRDVIYASLPPQTRRELHRDAARAIGSGAPTPGTLGAVAHHLCCAFPLADADEVARSCTDAARHALSRMAYSEAAAHCRRALEALGEGRMLRPVRRCELLLALATAQLRDGRRTEGRESLRTASAVARQEGLVEQLAEAALAIAPGFFSIETGVVDLELIRTLDEALHAVPERDSLVRVRLLGNLASALYWSPNKDRVRELVGEACSVAAHVGTKEARAYALAARFIGLWAPETLTERARNAQDIAQAADETGDDDLRLMARVFRVATLMECGDLGGARRDVRALENLVTSTRHPHAQWYPPMYQAMWEITRGRFALAEPLIARFVELGKRFDDANVIQTFLLQSAEICWQAGSVETILQAVEDNVSRNPALREWECALAFLLARAGRRAEATRVAGHLVADQCSGLTGRMNATIGLAALAEYCWLLDDPETADAIHDLVVPLGDRMVVAGYGVLCWGSLSRALGHLAAVRGLWDEAEARYRRAIESETEAQAMAWLARTEIAFARMLVRRGRIRDLEKARRAAEHAVMVAKGLGLPALVAEALAVGVGK